MSALPIAVLGAGSWGTALAILLARNGQSVTLWGHDPQALSKLSKDRCNTDYLPDISFPDNLIIQADLAAAIKHVQDILVVVPSFAFRETVIKIKPYLSAEARIAWGTKGLDPQSGELLHEVVEKLLGAKKLGVIAGPSIAKEVAQGLPTAVTVAANELEFAHDLSQRLTNKVFRAYTSTDIVGIEICGAVKNVLAIAAGIVDGLQMGANTLSALITRGLAEMTRLGIALGGKPASFMGLAGVGDLILTCTTHQSRNRRFGLAVASGMSVTQAEQAIGQAVEGLYNLKLVYQLALHHKVTMPITESVYQVLYEGLSAQTAIIRLLSREIKNEGNF